jgi:hypothetical protein
VLDELHTLLLRYVVLPDHAAAGLVLWLAHTYLVDATDYTPYIHVTSPVRESGKSTLLELLLHLAWRAQMTGDITATALYRRIHRLSATMLLDEVDTRLRGQRRKPSRGAEYRLSPGRKVTICVGDRHEDQDLNTFGPKVLAASGASGIP